MCVVLVAMVVVMLVVIDEGADKSYANWRYSADCTGLFLYFDIFFVGVGNGFGGFGGDSGGCSASEKFQIRGWINNTAIPPPAV